MFHQDQGCLVPLVDAQYFDDKFSGPEQDAIGRAVSMLKDATASEASEYFRGDVCWIVAGVGGRIPY